MLVELGVVEQRYDAVKEVLERRGTITEVAERHRVTRQSLHNWLRRYRERGMGRPGGPLKAAEELSPPDARPSRTQGDRAPPGPSPLGTQTARLRACPERNRSGSLALEHLPDPRFVRSSGMSNTTGPVGAC